MYLSGLDQYLTASPYDDGFEAYAEAVIEYLPEHIEEQNPEFVESNQFDNWLSKMYHPVDSVCPKEAAALIARAYRRYVKN